MGFKRFSLLISLRIALLTASIALLILTVFQGIYPTASVFVAAFVCLQTAEIVRFVRRTNEELSRFLAAARYADYSQRFEMTDQGAGFEELGETLVDIMSSFRDARQSQEEELRHLKALVDHVPVPLLSLGADKKIRLHNNAARRLFGSARVRSLDDLSQFGTEFAAQVASMEAGQRLLANFVADGVEKQLTLAATKIAIAQRVETLVSLQDIQSELDGAQLQAWQDLVRVLTHEIMNSITPVASLAKTAVDLVDDASAQLPSLSEQAEGDKLADSLGDIKSAVGTVARRSDALMHFVQSYRRLTHLPPPNKTHLKLEKVFRSICHLMRPECEAGGVRLDYVLEPNNMTIAADADQLEQVLINLVRNAQQALKSQDAACITLQGALSRNGHGLIHVVDNGPGIEADIAAKVFVPFFTTRREGSGVGLALTRQVMIAHGGMVSLSESAEGGAKITLRF